MKLGLKRFRDLPHTEGLLRLDWFGGISPNLNEPDNPFIECLFSPITKTPTPENPEEIKWKRDMKNQIRAGISVGYLPSLFLGQYFKSGKRAPLAEWQPMETITFELNTGDASAITETYLPDISIESWSAPASARFEYTANRAGIKKLIGRLHKTDHKKIAQAFKKFPVPFELIIHEIELIRFYLTNSEYSCKQIFTGAFQNDQLFVRVINALHEAPSFDPQTESGRFIYRHGYKQEDALSLGRILFEPNAHALHAAQRVHKQIVADRINHDGDQLGYARADFPFSGSTHLRLSGRRLKTATGYIFLACRILGCTGPFPFKHLSYCDEITPGGVPAPDDAPIAFPGLRTIDSGPAHSDGNDETTGESASDERPSSASARIAAQLGARDYGALKDVTLKVEKLRDSTHRSKSKFPQYLESLLNASTGAGTLGASSCARQTITERNLRPSTVSPDLETFIQVLKGLRTLKAAWGVKTICVGHGTQDEASGEWFSFFPEVRCEKRKSIVRQFSFMDKEKLIGRRFLCAEIQVEGRYFYLFEAQRRLRDTSSLVKGQSLYKEDLPILLLRGAEHGQYIGVDFLPFMKLAVTKETWPAQDELKGFVRDYTVHGLGAQSVDEITSRIVDLVMRNLQNEDSYPD